MTTRAQNQPTGYQILTSGLVALKGELCRPIVHSLPDTQARLLTPDGARGLLAELRKLAAEGLI